MAQGMVVMTVRQKLICTVYHVTDAQRIADCLNRCDEEDKGHEKLDTEPELDPL